MTMSVTIVVKIIMLMMKMTMTMKMMTKKKKHRLVDPSPTDFHTQPTSTAPSLPSEKKNTKRQIIFF